jgi:hypothetical protein
MVFSDSCVAVRVIFPFEVDGSDSAGVVADYDRC